MGAMQRHWVCPNMRRQYVLGIALGIREGAKRGGGAAVEPLQEGSRRGVQQPIRFPSDVGGFNLGATSVYFWTPDVSARFTTPFPIATTVVGHQYFRNVPLYDCCWIASTSTEQSRTGRIEPTPRRIGGAVHVLLSWRPSTATTAFASFDTPSAAFCGWKDAAAHCIGAPDVGRAAPLSPS